MPLISDVMSRARALVGDPDGDFATDAYLLPLIAQAYDEQMAELEVTGAAILERVVVLPGVAAGTTDLTPYQAQTMPDGTGQGTTIPGPLYGLQDVERLEWKQAGQPDWNYIPAVARQILPDMMQAPTSIGFAASAGMFYEFRDFQLFVTPLNFATDLRLRGEIQSSALWATDTVVVPRMVAALAYGTAALIGVDRNNDTWKEDYLTRAQSALDTVANQLVRSRQGTTFRLGRINRRRR